MVRELEMVFITSTSSTIHSVFLMPSASNSAGCAFVPDGMTQLFIPEGSGDEWSYLDWDVTVFIALNHREW